VDHFNLIRPRTLDAERQNLPASVTDATDGRWQRECEALRGAWREQGFP
ncbi:unnamed protein product, partial [Amoebophrya sp. A25]